MFFDALPLFTQVPIEEEIFLNQQALPMDLPQLPDNFLNQRLSSLMKNTMNRQTAMRWMGSPLSSVVDNYFRKILKRKVFHH